MKNRIYVFTGTGNSLYVAKKISKALADCEIIGINKNTSTELEKGFERIGIVFPCYGGGMPTMVKEFLEKIQLPEQEHTYLFAISTTGGSGGNVISMVNQTITNRGWKLNFGHKIWSYPNFIVGYNMFNVSNFFNNRTNKGMSKFIDKLVNKTNEEIKPVSKNSVKMYEMFLDRFKDIDLHYNVADTCTSCGVCANICPSKNISMENGKPKFNGKCEKCVACIHSCKEKAINFKDKTQKRRRYINPNITINEIIDCNN